MTKKDTAFELFDAGFSSSSPEVKALKLKAQTRANYYWLWKKGREGKTLAPHGGEGVGGIDETRQRKEATLVQAEGEQETPLGEAEEGEVEESEEATPKPKAQDEGIGTVSEVVTPKGKDGKPDGPERKMATTIADDGIKCTVLLSLQTLALFRIAATTQAQFDGGGELSLGDFLDTCAEDFFRVRGKKLGLISSGGR